MIDITQAPYTLSQHWTYMIMGLILLGVIGITIRAELNFLQYSKGQKVQMVLSVSSLIILIFLTAFWLLHWFLSPVFIVTITMLLVPLLLILAPLILLIRSRSFKHLNEMRRKEKEHLLLEVRELMDEKKREKIRQGKIERGESVD